MVTGARARPPQRALLQRRRCHTPAESHISTDSDLLLQDELVDEIDTDAQVDVDGNGKRDDEEMPLAIATTGKGASKEDSVAANESKVASKEVQTSTKDDEISKDGETASKDDDSKTKDDESKRPDDNDKARSGSRWGALPQVRSDEAGDDTASMASTASFSSADGADSDDSTMSRRSADPVRRESEFTGRYGSREQRRERRRQRRRGECGASRTRQTTLKNVYLCAQWARDTQRVSARPIRCAGAATRRSK